jgi:hypothetical protein
MMFQETVYWREKKIKVTVDVNTYLGTELRECIVILEFKWWLDTKRNGHLAESFITVQVMISAFGQME